MDDATTAFATACAVIAASTGMVLCLAPKSVNDAVFDEELMMKEEKGAASDEAAVSSDEVADLTEEPMKEQVTEEPILAEEPVTVDETTTNDVISTMTEAIPEQRPDDSTANDNTISPIKKKRRFTLRGDRSQDKPSFKKSQSMKWLPFRKKNEAVNVGQEV
jgi:hypothetical protein